VAAVVVAAALAGVIIGVGQSMTSTVQAQGKIISDKMESQIMIVNDPRQVPYHGSNLTLYVKNTGEGVINDLNIDVFLDGVLCVETNVTVSGRSEWEPSTLAIITLNTGLSSGDHQVKVVLSNGVYDSMMFRID
jgi:archaellum component FlaG (FlaF/FlaG flagellin family)